MRRRPLTPRLEALEDRALFAVGLVAAFAFDENAGLTVADASGSGNNGSITGATWTTAGRFGNALSFDGVNDWVTVADAPSLDVTTGLTLEAWVRPSTLAGWRTVFTKEIGGGEVYQLYASNGATPAAYLSTTSGGDQGTAAAAGIGVNVWTHLASTFDGSVLRLYVNGALAASQNVSGSILTTASPLRIGGNAPWGEYFSGQLDELRVYNRALSASEIAQDMNAPVSPAPDVTPPTVTAVSPADNASNVAATASVTATFSEAIDPSTLSPSTFELRTSGGVLVSASVSYDATSRIATLTPTAALAGSATFTARVKGGASGVKDLAGNALAADRVWSFTTVSSDVTPPTVTAVAPADNASNVAATASITATFSEAIDPSTLSPSTFELRTSGGVLVSASVSYDATSRIATLTPTAALAGSATFTARVKGGVSGVKDLAGNALAVDRVWSFTTAATGGFVQTTAISGLTNPTVVRFAPDGRVFVAEKSGVIKVFDNLADTTPTVFADLNVTVFNAWDRGLLGMALSPDWATNPYVYVLYALDAHTNRNAPVWGTPGVYGDPLPTPPGPTANGVVVSGRISRLRVQSNGTAGAEEILIDKQWLQQYPSHSTGALQFGPDGALYATAGDGASFSFVDYGQTPVNVDPRNPSSMGDPLNEGGALRSQDLRSSGDPVTLAGSLIRIDPNTGTAPSSNPLAGNADANAQRIVAYGMRNPFRFTFRPGTTEIWIGDVGWDRFEEIDRVVSPTDAVVENFGWPAYEGAGRQTGYDAADLPLLESLYATPNAVTAPYFAYSHDDQVASGSGEPTGGSSISGLAFYSGSSYPTQYHGALFFSDYSRNWIWAMLPGANGLPDPNNRVSFVANAAGPVNLEIGPNGDLFYVGFNDGSIRRIQFVSSNRPPVAVAGASPTAGLPPLTVRFDGSGSSDPDVGTTLTYAWDLDGDGQFDDSTAVAPTWTYASAGDYTASLRVSDGQLSNVASVTIRVGNTAPTAFIDLPLPLNWEVGQTIAFAGHATDPEQGTLAASALTWSVIIHHNTHTHPYQTFAGVASGSFVAPDHDYPAFLELRLTATDSGGLSSTVSVNLDPLTVDLTFLSNLPGVVVGLNDESEATPFEHTVILGSNNTMSAPATLPGVGGTYELSWSDGGAPTHNFVAEGATSYTANYVLVPVVSVSDATVTEGNLGTTDLTFTLMLSAPTTRAVSVNWTTADGTAMAGSDYVAVPGGSVTFDAGQTSKTVTVTVLGDTLVEPNETLLVNLNSPANVTLGDAQGQGTINNDDLATVLGTDGFGYRAETATFEAIDLVAGGPGVFSVLRSGDNSFTAANLKGGGATFNFYGTTYTKFYVNSNGMITFGTGSSAAANTNLTSSPTQRVIAGLWDDWASTIGQPMILGKFEDVNGDGVNDRLILEWNNVKYVSSPGTVTFQMILSLNTGSTPGEIVFNYVDLDTGDTHSNGGSATVGIKDVGVQGANRLLLSFDDATNPVVGSGKAIRIRYAP